MEIRVLGELEVIGDAGPVLVRALKHRQLLAALVVHAGEARSTDELIDALWGARPPASAAKLLQVYVSRLRALLPAPAVIHTRGQSYRLELDKASLDCTRFERLLAEGEQALRDRNPGLASSLLRRALALWRGRAYGELSYMELARSEAERLEELRLVALQTRTEAELAAGRHAGLVGELQALAATHPLSERIQAQLMLCLYRCGRHSEALEVFSALRARLRDELGLAPGSDVRELQQRILQHDPELDVAPQAETPVSALPAPPNRLLGRERELAELVGLLPREDVRLLVMTGAGGSGKTRLALEAARQAAPAFANGAAFVSLAAVRDPGLLPGTIAHALGIQALAGEPIATLAAGVRSQELLLLIDNVEHLWAAAPVFIELLARAPRLTLLITSRVVLHLSGEYVYPVEPLEQDAAVALFLARARAAEPRFRNEATDEVAIGHICERLDGLPLAIELAASRIRVLAAAELLARLDARLPLLVGGPRDLPVRQQTLRATLEWSHDLLSDSERQLFARLAVFEGGSSLEATTTICDAKLDTLQALVENNLVRRTGDRYWMLETVREYASERLVASGELEELEWRHYEFFLVLAQSLESSLDAEGRDRIHLVAPDQDNFRAALDRVTAQGDAERALRLALALEQWLAGLNPVEGRRRFEAILALDGEVPDELRARALRALGGARQMTMDDEAATRAFEASLELFRAIGDDASAAGLMHRLSLGALYSGDTRRARGLAEETSEAMARAGGGPRNEAKKLRMFAQIEAAEGNHQRALELSVQAARIAKEIGWTWWEEGLLLEAAQAALRMGRGEEAESWGREGLRLAHRLDDGQGLVYGLALLAWAAAARRDAVRAGRLWGAVESIEASGRSLGGWPGERAEFAGEIEMPDSDFEPGRQDGRRTPLAAALQFALGAQPQSAPAP